MASDLEIYICETREQRSFARSLARQRFSSSGGGEPAQYGWMEMKVGGLWLHEDVVFGQDLEFTEVRQKLFRKRYDWNTLRHCPGVWIGRMSWAKASLDGDVEGYVPDLVYKVTQLFSGRKLVMINDALIEQLEQCYAESKKHEYYTTSERDEVIPFLQKHKGKRAFAPNS